MDEKEARMKLFSVLNDVLSVSHKKFSSRRSKDCMRIKWGRLMKDSIQVYGKLLDSVQLDELMKEIDLIKKELKMKT